MNCIYCQFPCNKEREYAYNAKTKYTCTNCHKNILEMGFYGEKPIFIVRGGSIIRSDFEVNDYNVWFNHEVNRLVITNNHTILLDRTNIIGMFEKLTPYNIMDKIQLIKTFL